MDNKQFFEIPADPEVMARLVEAVPDHWRWVTGSLYPTKKLIASGVVQEDTGFVLARFHNINPTIAGTYDRSARARINPNFFAIMVDRKMPGFVFFDEAGLDCQTLPFSTVKRLAAGFIRNGYGDGFLDFRSNDHDNYMADNPARCNMIFQRWHGGEYHIEKGPQVARIRVEWEEKFGGTKEHVAPIVSVCQSLKLREYQPVAPPIITA